MSSRPIFSFRYIKPYYIEMLSTAETGVQISRKQMYRVICHLEAIPNLHQLMQIFTNKKNWGIRNTGLEEGLKFFTQKLTHLVSVGDHRTFHTNR